MNQFLKPLLEAYEQAANPENAIPMKKYMRDQFEFFGIKSPVRKRLFREFVQQQGLPALVDLDEICRDLWHLPEREYQYSAMDLLDRMRRHLTPDFIPLLEYLITTKSWWDTIDGLASHSVGDLFKKYTHSREASINTWRISDNFWLRRVTLLFQLRYKQETDEALLFSLILENTDSDEFFIQKAIGWALREYSKTNATAVTTFVNNHTLPSLSQREALKWLKKQQT